MRPAIGQHIAWDYGAVSSLFVDVLKPKTRKTLCGKTVAFRNTTDCIEAATCEACKAQHADNVKWQDQSAALFLKYKRD